MDNDPIAKIFIEASKRLKIKTVLIQEALLRPYEYIGRSVYLSDYAYRLLSFFGIYLKYTIYGGGGCDFVISSGRNSSQIFIDRGVPSNKIHISGYPKYDLILKNIDYSKTEQVHPNHIIYAASTSVVENDSNVNFLKRLVEATINLNLSLTIKLHPRGSTEPDNVLKILKEYDLHKVKVIKVGEDTFELLKTSYALITVSSTSVLEALLMDKECILVNFLAGEAKLEYKDYNALYCIDDCSDIDSVLQLCINSKKPFQNKLKLLGDELHILDGSSSSRVAQTFESFLAS
jgi:hypothetical protein